MNLIPNPASVRLVADLRELLDAIRTLPVHKRDNRSLGLQFSTSKQTMQNRLNVLIDGALVVRGVSRVLSGHNSFVYTFCATESLVDAYLDTVLMKHARAAGDQRHAIAMPRVSPNKGKKRAPDATERARATVALKASMRTPGTMKRDPLVAALFGKAVPA